MYDIKSDAKLLESNVDTPTSLYESGFCQWLWLQKQIERGALPSGSDQFNSLQDKLIEHFRHLRNEHGLNQLTFSSCLGKEEDRSTVQHLSDCATEVGIKNTFYYVEEISLNEDQQFCNHN